MEKINKTIYASIIASQVMHLFCCVLPTLLGVMSVVTGVGMVAALPGFLENAHHLMHDYELPMLVTSGLALLFGWLLYAYSLKFNCVKDGGCCHDPCEPKKDKTRLFMGVATALFVVNMGVYLIAHHPMDTHGHGESQGHHHHHH